MAHDYIERLDLQNAEKVVEDRFRFTLLMSELKKY
jgi:hypothetical protein